MIRPGDRRFIIIKFRVYGDYDHAFIFTQCNSAVSRHVWWHFLSTLFEG